MNNTELKEIVNAEITQMRADIICEMRNTQTGIFIGFKADMGECRLPYSNGHHEYAFITGYKFHRIQSANSIISKLRSDRRLYN